MRMEIARLYRSRSQEAMDLVWETFLKFEAPEYSEEGILTFHDFIRNERELERLEIFGAEIDGAVVGVLAMRGNHISLFFVEKTH
ncbi:GNAT family N-acetyltransferase [Anaerostipes caccae]|uniref:GNAT family N-acetyltransferase n=1 Tax=Anaerostipes caccae TaxID=105841 RepID=UPI0039A21F16